MDFRKQNIKSSGLRNNNPGNLIEVGIDWKGKDGSYKNADGPATRFIDVKYGLRALIKDIYADYNDGLNTPLLLIKGNDKKNGFAVGYKKGDQEYYAGRIAKALEINPGDQYIFSKNNIEKIIKVIVNQENGSEASKIPQEDYDWALNNSGVLFSNDIDIVKKIPFIFAVLIIIALIND